MPPSRRSLPTPPVLPKSLILPLGENLLSPCLVLLLIGEKLSSPLDARFLEGKACVLPTSDPYNAGLGALLMDGPRWLHLISSLRSLSAPAVTV